VLTAGELPALVVIDAVARLLPGVLGKDESAASETFAEHRWSTRTTCQTRRKRSPRPDGPGDT